MVPECKVIAMLAALERMKRWVAILGLTSKHIICGIGASVETALRAFDDNYLFALRLSAPKLRRDGSSAD